MTEPSVWRVLVVDDDAGMRETLSEILGAHDIAAVTAGTAAAAQAILVAEPIALAILDQRLPDATGIELAEAIKATDPDLPVLLMTG
ncbi:MAG: response regulator, partial [Frankiaceae bacterium]|nr:response regulator [Frankiaceae bacterium]